MRLIHWVPVAWLMLAAPALAQDKATIDGQIVGGWTRSRGGKSVTVTLRPLIPLTTSDQRAIASEVTKFAAFLGLEGRFEV